MIPPSGWHGLGNALKAPVSCSPGKTPWRLGWGISARRRCSDEGATHRRIRSTGSDPQPCRAGRGRADPLVPHELDLSDDQAGSPSRPWSLWACMGASKAAGERMAFALPGVRVLRTSWIHGPVGRNFCRAMLRLHGARMAAGEPHQQGRSLPVGSAFMGWYNHHGCHSGIRLLKPQQRHRGAAVYVCFQTTRSIPHIRQTRTSSLDAAKQLPSLLSAIMVALTLMHQPLPSWQIKVSKSLLQ
ncbi:MAG: hypothetical protein ERJ67_01585 [Aphanocapsa feldmannii 277cV]|uniref:Uncharacterized protein n=1 Tax=Aphanocapsa feldmannii 277cV TaxID=2507553 RepID=A0A524RQL4_9CHRO|nr:MAG: hypothetical protein ERJ67_01585 [Aphanocapsa feldmannii 277cV]